MHHRIIDTFTGPFAIIQRNNGQLMTSWLTAQTQIMLSDSRHNRNLLPSLARQLHRYFDGGNADFSDVPTPEGSDFFARCWAACREIERGETRSYAELAALAGSSPTAARAAGQAMRHNPLPIIVPCHRVIGSGGRLHGFGGSCDHQGQELGIKAALLKMEQSKPDLSGRRLRKNAPERRELALTV